MFKSKKEMARAMLDGKVVEFDNGATAYWDEDADNSPFRYKKREVGCTTNLSGAWAWREEAIIQQEWHDKVSKEKPGLCWVSDYEADKREMLCFIVDYRGDWYRSTTGTKWKYATPVKPEELGE